MSAATERQLGAINHRFYERFAAEFSATRERPWPGWERIAEHTTPPIEGKTIDF